MNRLFFVTKIYLLKHDEIPVSRRTRTFASFPVTSATTQPEKYYRSGVTLNPVLASTSKYSVHLTEPHSSLNETKKTHNHTVSDQMDLSSFFIEAEESKNALENITDFRRLDKIK